jgi:hypothetical protein
MIMFYILIIFLIFYLQNPSLGACFGICGHSPLLDSYSGGAAYSLKHVCMGLDARFSRGKKALVE